MEGRSDTDTSSRLIYGSRWQRVSEKIREALIAYYALLRHRSIEKPPGATKMHCTCDFTFCRHRSELWELVPEAPWPETLHCITWHNHDTSSFRKVTHGFPPLLPYLLPLFLFFFFSFVLTKIQAITPWLVLLQLHPLPLNFNWSILGQRLGWEMGLFSGSNPMQKVPDSRCSL